ncbi:MAG TPA: FxSxx-COOH system tetratricopeptide repeat protein [Ktedonobacteraceae bacterium]|nr:FxSxx-COOH system tetratricopeptide repeat protein [Ktedonobacteraceae bacterium]
MTLEEGHWKSILRRERIQRNWRQPDLAEQLGISVVTVQRWEKGSQMPGPYFRLKLSLLFGKSAVELGFVVPPPPQPPVLQEESVQEAFSTPERSLWNIPHPRNPHFTGREELLAHLQRRLVPQMQAQQRGILRLALTGLGGIGKTQVAVEYAYRAQEQGCYSHIFWINAANEEDILASFVSLAELLPGVSGGGEHDQRKLMAIVKRWLEECSQPWLLIVDNADELSLVQPFLPQRGGSLLLTTRAHAAGSLAETLEVEAMGLVEGMQLLLQRAQQREVSEEERNEAMNVVIALDHFPLALDQAGAYLEETGCRFVDYLQLYQLHRRELLARRGKQASSYPASVATTWSLSFCKIEQASPAAAELLRLCAFLAPDALPEEVLTEGAAHWPALLAEKVVNPLAFNELLEVLLAFSLVKRLTDQRALSVHRLVQAVQRDAMAVKEQRQWAERAVCALNTVFPANPRFNPASWPQCRRYLGQVQACDALIQEYQLSFPEAAALLERAARYLWEQASYALARPLYRRALQIRELQDGPEHPLVASVLTGLANLHWKQGEYVEAEQLYQRALRILEQQGEQEQVEMASILNGLANLYRDQGRYEASEQLYQQAARMLEQQFGSEHPQVAAVLNNLAIIAKTRGKYEESERLYQQALAVLERQSGSEHPLLVSTITGLANLSTKQGKHAEAEQLYQRAVRMLEQQFGSEYPGLAHPLGGLARLYTKQERYAEAEACCQRGLRLWEKKFGAEHPDLTFPLYDLAELYVKQSRYMEAEPLYQRALHICMQQLEPGHPRTAGIRERLNALFPSGRTICPSYE